MTESELVARVVELLNTSVVRPTFPGYYGETDFRCVEITFDKETFVQLEQLLGCKIRGRLESASKGLST